MSSSAPELKAGDAPYPRNQWYVAAYSHEVGRTPLHRWLLDEPVVLFRKECGDPVALNDRCPHRGLRLSAGKLVGDTIQCTYHGMRFAPDGLCVAIPSGGAINARMCVPSYPLVEQWQWLWIWMGDPQLADPALIPDIVPFGFGADGWYHEPSGLLPLKANYLLPFENLLDASHISFLHHGLIDSGDVASMPFHSKYNGNWLHVIREIANEPISPLTQKTFGFSGSFIKRTITADAHVPNLCGIRVDVVSPEDAHIPPRTNQLLVGITPETRTACFEFTAVAQSFPFENPNREDDVRNLLMEDVVVMEDIQRLFNELDSERCVEISVPADGPALRMRRIVAAMLERE